MIERHITVRGVRSLRDLRASVLQAAGELTSPQDTVVVRFPSALMNPERIQEEWVSALGLLRPGLARRMRLVEDTDLPERRDSNAYTPARSARPNFRFEVLRTLSNAWLEGSPAVPVLQIQSLTRSSETAVRSALGVLHEAGLVNVAANRARQLAPTFARAALGQIETLPAFVRYRWRRGTLGTVDALHTKAFKLVSTERKGWPVAPHGTLGSRRCRRAR